MDLFALPSQLRVPKIITAFCLSLFWGSAFAAVAEDPEPSKRQTRVVQVLAYKGDTLLNQGSGFAVADNGVIATSAHLLSRSDRIVVRKADGQEMPAIAAAQDESSDIAILRAEGDFIPIVFSSRAVAESDTLQISGYWHNTQEEARRSFFGLSGKPGFVASIVPEPQAAKALVNPPVSDTLKLITSVGRGAYGAALLNRCGQLQGIIRPDPAKSLTDLWQPHLPLGGYAAISSQLEALLKSLSIDIKQAPNPCLSVAEQQKAAEAAKQQQVDKAEKKAKEAEQAAKKAQQAADNEKQAREDAEKGREEVSSVVADINKKAEQVDSENTEIKEDNRLLFKAVIAAVIGGVLLALLLILKRRKDLSAANRALQAATATFGDCRFEGVDSAGSPMAFVVPGKDLMQRENGLTVGRNPEMAQVVIADDTVSRQHAQLYVQDGYLYVRDLGSTGGTRINDVVVSETGAAIISGDRVEFGNARFAVTIKETAG